MRTIPVASLVTVRDYSRVNENYPCCFPGTSAWL